MDNKNISIKRYLLNFCCIFQLKIKMYVVGIRCRNCMDNKNISIWRYLLIFCCIFQLKIKWMLLWYMVGYIHNILIYHLFTNHQYLSPNKRHQQSIRPLKHHLNIHTFNLNPNPWRVANAHSHIPFEESVGDLDGKPPNRHK